MSSHLLLILLGLLSLTWAYIDIDASIDEAAEDVVLNMPMALGTHPYKMGLSLENRQ